MEKGKLIYDLPTIDEIQQYHLANIKKLPDEFKVLEENHLFKLKISEELNNLTNSLKEKYS